MKSKCQQLFLKNTKFSDFWKIKVYTDIRSQKKAVTMNIFKRSKDIFYIWKDMSKQENEKKNYKYVISFGIGFIRLFRKEYG